MSWKEILREWRGNPPKEESVRRVLTVIDNSICKTGNEKIAGISHCC